jgi:hypothetical protein
LPQGVEPGTLLYAPSDLERGFFPISIFHRLCAGALGCSYDTSLGVALSLDRSHAYIAVKKELVVLSYLAADSSVAVRLASNGKSGSAAAVADELRVLLTQELSSYSNLRFLMLVPLPGSDRAWVDLAELPQCTLQTVRMDGEVVDVEELKVTLAHWKTVECNFYFVLADELRKADDAQFTEFLSLQEMRLHFKHWIVRKPISFENVCKGAYRNEYLAVSHRWEERLKADSTGAQLTALRNYLSVNPRVKYVWLDQMCLTQGAERTPLDKAEFNWMLANVNFLYLGLSALILMDISYVSRFWTCYEAWLCFQLPSTTGLVPTPDAKLRCSIVRLHGARQSFEDDLRQQWHHCTAEEAHRQLSSPAVTVTNASDKLTQLEKIAQFDAMVQRFMRNPERVSDAIPSEDSLRQAFAAFDTDGSGSISQAELITVLQLGGGPAAFSAKGAVTAAEAIIRDFDQNGDGELQYDEFLAWRFPEVAESRVEPNSSAQMQPASPHLATLAQKVERIKRALELDAALPLPRAIRDANAAMGLPPTGSLPAQADALLAHLGV